MSSIADRVMRIGKQRDPNRAVLPALEGHSDHLPTHDDGRMLPRLNSALCPYGQRENPANAGCHWPDESVETQPLQDIFATHPGPINRGLEMESEVADGRNSVILQQVTNGLAARMAALFLVTQAAAETAA